MIEKNYSKFPTNEIVISEDPSTLSYDQLSEVIEELFEVPLPPQDHLDLAFVSDHYGEARQGFGTPDQVKYARYLQKLSQGKLNTDIISFPKTYRGYRGLVKRLLKGFLPPEQESLTEEHLISLSGRGKHAELIEYGKTFLIDALSSDEIKDDVISIPLGDVGREQNDISDNLDSSIIVSLEEYDMIQQFIRNIATGKIMDQNSTFLNNVMNLLVTKATEQQKEQLQDYYLNGSLNLQKIKISLQAKDKKKKFIYQYLCSFCTKEKNT